MKHQPARGAQARYTRALHEQLTQRERVVMRALGELAPLWAGDHVQLGEALGRLMSALPLELDTEQLLAFGRVAQEHATAQARVQLAASRRRSQRRDADDLPRRISTLPLWDEDPELRDQVETWATANAAMIQGLDERTRARIVEAVQRAGEGSSLSDLSSLVVEELGRGRRNAELLARDQVGRLASDTAQHQMERAGATHYIWRAVDDERTRSTHRARDGEIFSWDAPPTDGHPGQAPLCRCYAEPLFDDDWYSIAPQELTSSSKAEYDESTGFLPPDLYDMLKSINPHNFKHNCSECALATEMFLATEESGLNIDIDSIIKLVKGTPDVDIETTIREMGERGIISDVYNFIQIDGDPDEGERFRTRAASEQIKEYIEMDIYKRGIVFGDRGYDSEGKPILGHTFNVAKRNEEVIFFDGQTPAVVDPTKFVSLVFVPIE